MMYKLKLEGIKKYFDTDDKYFDFIYEIDGIWVQYVREYAFLGISEKSWNTLFNNIVKYCLNKNCPDNISKKVKEAINKYIKKQLDEKNPRILRNILISLSKEGWKRRELLQVFFRRLELLGIKLDEEFYDKLKENSALLKSILRDWGIYDLSLKEFKKFLEQKDDFYEKFIKRGKSYAETVKLVDYAISCFENSSEVKQDLVKESSEYSRKIERFISNYDTILNVHRLFEQRIGKTNDRLIDRAILNYSEIEWNQWLQQYQRYLLFEKDFTFLNRLASKVGVRNIEPIQVKVPNTKSINIPREKEEVGSKIDSKKQSYDLSEKKDSKSLKKQEQSLYDFFLLQDKIDEVMRKKLVDFLFNELFDNIKLLVMDYLAGKEQTKDEISIANAAIQYMQNVYKTEGLNLLNYNLYEKFPLSAEVDEATRKELVDKLLDDFYGNRSNGEGAISRRLSNQDIASLQEKYSELIKQLKVVVKPKRTRKKKALVKYFPLQDGINEEVREKIVNILVNELSDDIRTLISDYIAGKELSELDIDKVKKEISKMQRKYERRGVSLLEDTFSNPNNPKCRKTLLERFSLQEGMKEKDLKQIVEVLFEELSKEEQRLVNGYVLGKKLDNKSVKKALNVITGMQKKYNKHGIKLLDETFRKSKKKSVGRKTLLEHFSLQEGMEEEKLKQIIKVLFDELSETEKMLVNDYVVGKYLSDNDVKKFRVIIRVMQRKYNEYGTKLLDEAFRKSKKKGYIKPLVERFKLTDDINEEVREKIVKVLVNELSDDIRTLISDYIAGKELSEMDIYKVKKEISKMQRKYERRGVSLLEDNFSNPNNPKCRKTLLEHFSLQEGMKEEELKQIVKVLFEELSEEKQRLVNGYVLGKKLDNKSVKKAIIVITGMQKKYNKHGIKLLDETFRKSKKKGYIKPLVERFELTDDINEEVRQQIVKVIFDELSESQKVQVNDYIAGNKEYADVKNIITCMQRKYNEYGTKLLDETFRKGKKKGYIKPFVERFKLTDDINEEVRQQIVKVIFDELSESQKALVNDYIAGKKDYADVKNIITYMQVKYKRCGKSLLEDSNADSKFDIKEYFQNIILMIKEAFGVELKSMSQNKMNVLYDALKLIEYIYRSKLGMTKEDYDKNFKQRLIEVFMNGQKSLENLLVLYINSEYYGIMQAKVIRSRKIDEFFK